LHFRETSRDKRADVKEGVGVTKMRVRKNKRLSQQDKERMTIRGDESTFDLRKEYTSSKQRCVEIVFREESLINFYETPTTLFFISRTFEGLSRNRVFLCFLASLNYRKES
jgi:hypothetical protein